MYWRLLRLCVLSCIRLRWLRIAVPSIINEAKFKSQQSSRCKQQHVKGSRIKELAYKRHNKEFGIIKDMSCLYLSHIRPTRVSTC